MQALHLQLDLYLTGGTYHNATLRLGSYSLASQPLYLSRIQSFTVSKELPDPLQGGLAKRSASLRLGTKDLGRKDAPTLAAILATEDPRGKRARVRLYDPNNNTYPLTIEGFVSAIGADYASLTIEGDDAGLLTTLLPKLRALDICPSADVSLTESNDPPVCVVAGPMARVTLPLAHATWLELVYAMGGADADKYRYDDLDYVPNATVASGDRLVYDVSWSNFGDLVALDLHCTDGTNLRNTAAVDQNGISASPTSNLDAYISGRWYRREIDLSALVGKTIDQYLVACERDGAVGVSCKIANAYILDSAGNTKVTLFDETIGSVTTTLISRNNAATTLVATRQAVWDYGPIRPELSGTLSVTAAYADAKVKLSSEYSIQSFLGYKFIRFTQRQMDSQGRRAKLQVDLDSTEFARNPVTFASFVWSNATYGLGQSVNAASFTAAASTLSSNGMDKLVGGLSERLTVQQILRNLSVRGLSFDLNNSGEVLVTVDDSSLHTAAPVTLGQEDTLGLRNAQLVANTGLTRAIAEQIKEVHVFGFRDPGLGPGAQGSFLIEAKRTRAIGGRVENREHPWIGTGAMADREADYLYKLLSSFDLDIEVETGLAIGRQIGLGQTIKFTAPRWYFSGATFVVRRVTCEGSRYRLRLVGNAPTLFTYSAGEVKVAPRVNALTDYSLTRPGTPTSFSFVSAAKRTDSEGNTEIVEQYTITLPSVNCSELVLRAYRQGVTLPLAEVRKSAITLGAANTIEIALKPGNSYDLEGYAYAASNHPDFRYSLPAVIASRTAGADTTAPADGTAIAVRQAGAKVVEIDATFTPPSDWAAVRLYRHTSNSSGSATEIDRGKKKRFHDNNVSYGSTYYYWFKVEDRSGNLSGFSPSSSHSITVGKIDSADVEDGAIGTNQVADNGVTSLKRATLNSATFSHVHAAVNHAHTVSGGVTSSDGIGQNTAITTITHNKGRQVLAVIDTGNSVIAGHYRNNGTSSFDVCTVNVANTGTTVNGSVYYF